MTTRAPRRRSAGRARLAVTVTTPDGGVVPRGLAAWLAKVAPPGARGDVTVALVSDGRMRSLNRSFRGKDFATDVLSFPVDKGLAVLAAGPDSRSYLGDLVIARGVAQRQAAEAGHAIGTEIRVLALHGLLHLLGYDHEADSGEMATTEAKLLKKAGLKAGLTGR